MESLKPELLREAYAAALFRLKISNLTGRAVNVSVEVGNSWDWQIIPPEDSWHFPTWKKEPLVACTSTGDEYVELVQTCDTAVSYELRLDSKQFVLAPLV